MDGAVELAGQDFINATYNNRKSKYLLNYSDNEYCQKKHVEPFWIINLKNM